VVVVVEAVDVAEKVARVVPVVVTVAVPVVEETLPLLVPVRVMRRSGSP
jgi:hypothetical protein